MTTTAPHLLSISHVSKTFEVVQRRWPTLQQRIVRAVSDVSLHLDRGETIGIVGESGSGKSTLARMLVRLIEPSSGQILFKGREIGSLTPSQMRTEFRPAVRMVFQDPDAALNPAYTIGAGLTRALELHGQSATRDTQRVIADVLTAVGIDQSFAGKYPDELSGGEKRRIGLCRALLTNPDIIIADEPLSGLDVVLQERVLGVLRREQEKRGFALLLISHDLDRVNQMCDRVLVMYGGRVVEDTRLERSEQAVAESYRHPYSMLLQRARLDVTHGEHHGSYSSAVMAHTGQHARPMPDEGHAGGCGYAPLCARRTSLANPEICATTVPILTAGARQQAVACHFPDATPL